MNKFRRFLLVYFFFCFSFFLFFSSGFIDSQDGFQYLVVARQMYYNKTFEMPKESHKNDQNIHMSLMPTNDGRVYSPTGIGYSTSLLPAVFLEDVFLRLSDQKPISSFPLSSDWPVLLFASMTNSFWGAIFVITIYLYLRELKLTHKDSLLLSFLFALGSNIFVYIHYSFPHMMFVALMILSLFFFKKYSRTKKIRDIFLSGFFLGGVVLTYNPTAAFISPAYPIYYLLINKLKFSKVYFKKLISDLGVFLLSFLPLLFIYIAFNKIRLGGTGITSYGDNAFEFMSSFPQAYVILEGLWGLLLSPGKSIFIYTPLLFLLIIFWFKIKRTIFPELFAALSVFVVYFWNIGTLLGGPDYLVWHGESSWGPRYVLPILPLFFLVIAYVYTQLSKKQKLFIFYPLVILGFYINLLAVVLPYQIKFAGLEVDLTLNGKDYNVYQYGNHIPRYMPAFKMSKTLFKRIKNIPITFNHGTHNVRLIDGFDYPFDLGWSVWRGMQPLSVLTFDNPDSSIDKLSLQVRNHNIDPSSSASAQLSFLLNGAPIHSEEVIIDEEKEIILPLDKSELKSKGNILQIESEYEATSSAFIKKKQALFLQTFRINDLAQNIQTIDYPYVSPISKSLFGVKYYFWGEQETDPWSIWHMHSGVYEQTFDIWWIRPLHYWDYPKTFFAILFLLNVGGIIFFANKTLKYSEKE